MSFPIEIIKEEKNIPICFLCSKEATISCSKCTKSDEPATLCDNCSNILHASPLLCDHNPKKIAIYSLQDLNQEQDLLCGLHKQPYTFYCDDCKSLICFKCQFNDHSKHNTELIEECYSKILELEQVKTPNCEESLGSIQKTIEELKKQSKQIEKKSQQQINLVKKYSLFLQEKIKEREQIILRKINIELRQNLSEIELQKNKFKNSESMLLQTNTYIENMEKSKKGNEKINYLYNYCKIKQIEDLIKKDFTLNMKYPILKEIKFQSVLESINDFDFVDWFNITGYKIFFDPITEINKKIPISIELFDEKKKYLKIDIVKKLSIFLIIRNSSDNEYILDKFDYQLYEKQNKILAYFHPNKIGKHYLTLKIGNNIIANINEKKNTKNKIKFIVRRKKDIWNSSLIDDSLILNEDGSQVTCIKKAKRDSWIHTTRIITEGVHMYKFRIDKILHCLRLGVTNPENHNDPAISGYVYYLCDGYKRMHGMKMEKYGQKCKNGDVITMIINMEKRTLQFLRNNNNLGIAYKYLHNKLVVAMGTWTAGNQLTII
ncbi:hypothetical protein M0812_14871 [Anaeramoeba flamelloides]|uniref:B box-type domain-containing protein n=1 Tax=Anaeramoeba flamelloides TaxID=1746091 RepID=A0AAV7Z9X8_9EUKA|nr:hypothetical protein M0812_14871 [Anaeramoeba flamelloides]